MAIERLRKVSEDVKLPGRASDIARQRGEGPKQSYFRPSQAGVSTKPVKQCPASVSVNEILPDTKPGPRHGLAVHMWRAQC